MNFTSTYFLDKSGMEIQAAPRLLRSNMAVRRAQGEYGLDFSNGLSWFIVASVPGDSIMMLFW